MDKRLREVNFGEDEGKVFDALSQDEKNIINSIDYQAPKGESYKESKKRIDEFISEIKVNKSLIFCHGGSLCSWTYDKGQQDVIQPGDVLGFSKESS